MDPIKVLDKIIELNPLGKVSKIAQRNEIEIQRQRNSEIRIKIINELITERIEHLDVGARDGIEIGTSPYADILSVILVEPDPIEATKLRDVGYRVIEKILSDVHGTQKTIFFSKKRGVSSVIEQNKSILRYYSPENHDQKRFDVEYEAEIGTTTISSLGGGISKLILTMLNLIHRGASWKY
jgi:hypothetical protein